MSRQADIVSEDRTSRLHKACIRALEFELEQVIEESRGQLLGFSLKCGATDYLVTLRVEEDGDRFVGHISGASIPMALVNCVSAIRRGKVRWTPDTYFKPLIGRNGSK